MRVSPHEEFLTHASRSGDAVVAAVADNCRFDERASADRWREFEALLPRPSAGSGSIVWADWEKAYQLHVDQRCNVAHSFVPDAFLEINREAWLETLSENQSLVRIEALNRPLQASALELGDLGELLHRADDGDSNAEHTVRTFF